VTEETKPRSAGDRPKVKTIIGAIIEFKLPMNIPRENANPKGSNKRRNRGDINLSLFVIDHGFSFRLIEISGMSYLLLHK
jgi:hypothetical protein